MRGIYAPPRSPLAIFAGQRTFLLEVEVELELSWMWTQANIINFLLTLEINPCVNEILGEYATLEQEIQERDRKDSTRDHAPLIQAEDATLVNTDGLSIEEVVAAIVNLYEQKVQNR